MPFGTQTLCDPPSLYLSWEEGRHPVPLHEEHVDEVDEDAGGHLGVTGREGQPLVDDHEDQVAKQAQQEQQLREEYQVQVELFPKMPTQIDTDNRAIKFFHRHTEGCKVWGECVL